MNAMPHLIAALDVYFIELLELSAIKLSENLTYKNPLLELIKNEESCMKTVYLYRGTFDPFHNNHAAICQWCLQQDNLTALVIHINYKEPGERNTKNPASWDTRFNMINNVITSMIDHNMLVSDKKKFTETINWITNQYGPNTRIVQVIGDDVLGLAKDLPDIHSYAIHQRMNDNPLELTDLIFNKERINIPLKLPAISSTHIRSLLIKRDWDTISGMVSPSIFRLLQTLPDYSPLQLSLQELKNHKINISDLFVQKLEVQFGKLVYLKYEPKQFSGLSGDFLVTVNCNVRGRIAICKIFINDKNDCNKELEGYKSLSNHVKTPSIYFSCEDGFCMELILGKHAQSIEDFTRIGQAYRQLHAHSLSDIEDDKPNQHDNLKLKMAEICNQFSELDLSNNIQSLFSKLLKNYDAVSHRKCVTHGDSQPGNTLITEDDVVFIDASKVKCANDAYSDLHQMIASIYWKAYHQEKTANVEDIRDKIHAFLEGYGCVINTPANELWSFYWRVRTVLLAMKRPETALSAHIITDFERDYPQLFVTKTLNYPFWKRSQEHLLTETKTPVCQTGFLNR